MDHRAVARKLSKGAAEVLIEHVDGHASIERPVNVRNRAASRIGLVRCGLLRYSSRTLRPETTTITENGRAVLCFVLADYADALTAAGYAVVAAPAAARSLGPFVKPSSEVAEAKDLHESV